ncbi:RDD family protein [Spongiactinospora sp. TRM90649]|uniref:RDD family protein n=1 Tax=Spongiactinospora sp. TRM90649 TaxID=3031114 RepID=UPI0023F694ED|nr:RDD family protein [Spongiactinospora sp. TRM90649]MDF5754440.1 RDD family protein [Spongiactinospora sp. TRM90649]
MADTFAPQSAPPLALASWWHRFAAALIDSVIMAVFIAPILYASPRDEETGFTEVLAIEVRNPAWPSEMAILALTTLYFGVQHALWGQTPGKRLCRVKVVEPTTGRPPGPLNAGIRALIYPLLASLSSLTALVSFVDLLWMLFDPRRRCLHDIAARTVVIDLVPSESRGDGRRGLLLRVGILVGCFAALAVLLVLIAR